MLTEKYRPKTFDEIVGQKKAIEKVKEFLKNFPKKKALLLYGPVGTGKTTLAYVIANEMNAEILEINASDFRNKENIKKIIGAASKQTSLFKKTKILLVDDVDGITKEDKGGLQELMKIIDVTPFPIIITANDIWDKKFYDLRKKAEVVELKEISYRNILYLLKKIAKKEKIRVDEEILKVIAIKARGDIRAALNDLQTIGKETKQKDISVREKEMDIFTILAIVLREIPGNEILSLYEKTNLSLDEITFWLEENIPEIYKGKELVKAFDMLSKADIFNSRIIKRQYWRFLVYRNIFLSAGIAYSKEHARIGFIKFKNPTRIYKMWAINQKYIYKNTIAEKFSKATHTSKKYVMKNFNIIKLILKNKKIQQQIGLEKEEKEFLKE